MLLKRFTFQVRIKLSKDWATSTKDRLPTSFKVMNRVLNLLELFKPRESLPPWEMQSLKDSIIKKTCLLIKINGVMNLERLMRGVTSSLICLMSFSKSSLRSNYTIKNFNLRLRSEMRRFWGFMICTHLLNKWRRSTLSITMSLMKKVCRICKIRLTSLTRRMKNFKDKLISSKEMEKEIWLSISITKWKMRWTILFSKIQHLRKISMRQPNFSDKPRTNS